MHRAIRHNTLLPLSAALAVCAVFAACSAPPNQTVIVDKEHNDSHRWDDRENQAWHRYLAENHRDDHDFGKADSKEQSDYWNWRHNHPD
jgi:hypothetical protein